MSILMGKKRDIPTYVDTHPPHLASANTLRREGLKPGRDQLPAALFKYKGKDLEGMCSLFERTECVPLEENPDQRPRDAWSPPRGPPDPH